MRENMTNGEIVVRGVVGTAAGVGPVAASGSVSGWVAAYGPALEFFFRVGSMGLGAAVAAVTLWQLLTKKKREKK